MLTLTNLMNQFMRALGFEKAVSTGKPLATPNRMVEEYVTSITAKKYKDGLYSLKVRSLKKSPPGRDGITSLVTLHDYCGPFSKDQATKICADFRAQAANGVSQLTFSGFNANLKNLGLNAWHCSRYPFMGIGVMEMHGASASSYITGWYMLGHSGNILARRFMKETKFFYSTVCLCGRLVLVTLGLTRSFH